MQIRDAILTAYRTQEPNAAGEYAICWEREGETECIIFDPEKSDHIRTADGHEWTPTYQALTTVHWHIACRVPEPLAD